MERRKMKKYSKIIILGILDIGALLFPVSCADFQKKFGKLPEGDRLRRIQESPNYKDGEFQNQIPTPVFSKDVSTLSVIWSNIFHRNEHLNPPGPIETVKTDLKALDPRKDTVVWLGHSSWFIQLEGKRILIDPTFSDHSGPVSSANKAFPGTNLYSPDDMPEIDYLLISHDHWDHLDYETVKGLRSKIKRVICPIGIGADFEYWDYPKEKILEADWNDEFTLEKNFTVHVLPARHYSGRLLKKNQTLWAAFALITPDRKLFYSGDSGYGPHFADIGETFEGFDLVLLDAGQYDSRWAYIHMTPEEAARAAEELGAKFLIPAHVGRFGIANHPWDEPFIRMSKVSKRRSYRLITPRIGEIVLFNPDISAYTPWWE